MSEEENDRIDEYWTRGEQQATLNQLRFNDVQSHLFYRSMRKLSFLGKDEDSVLTVTSLKDEHTLLKFVIMFGKYLKLENIFSLWELN